MTNKEKIKAEVDRLGKELVNGSGGLIFSRTVHRYFNKVISYIDSLPEENVSEDLEEAARNHAAERYRTTRDEFLAEKCKWSFVAGAEWDEKQMTKNAFDADVNTYECVGDSSYVEFVANLPVSQFRKDDKVKLIIIKED